MPIRLEFGSRPLNAVLEEVLLRRNKFVSLVIDNSVHEKPAAASVARALGVITDGRDWA